MINSSYSYKDILDEYINVNNISGGKELPSVWKKVLLKIGQDKNDDDETVTLGEKLAENSKVVDLKNGILLIETKHPGWIQYLKMYQKFIIKGLNWALPDQKINSLAFKVAGTEVSLSELYDSNYKKSIENYEKQIEKTEKKLNQNVEAKEKKELPDDLKNRFEILKNSVLTNIK